MIGRLIILLLSASCSSQVVAQIDSSARSTYFLEQSALPIPKGSLVFNNYYVLVNSFTYSLNERLKISAGLMITTEGRPPFYANAQYSIPLGGNVFVGGSIGFYQIDYSQDRSNYVIVPQLVVTKGDHQINTTLTGGVIRGKYLVGTGFFSSSMINLPSWVNLMLSLSHRRPLNKELSLITQNVYVSAQAPVGSRYSEVILLSGGLGWHLQRSTLKGGLGVLLFPKSEQGSWSSALPFLGYSYMIR
jgi:hypothetical protein